MTLSANITASQKGVYFSHNHLINSHKFVFLPSKVTKVKKVKLLTWVFSTGLGFFLREIIRGQIDSKEGYRKLMCGLY